jgi:hypothetical protein
MIALEVIADSHVIPLKQPPIPCNYTKVVREENIEATQMSRFQKEGSNSFACDCRHWYVGEIVDDCIGGNCRFSRYTVIPLYYAAA